MSNVTLIALGLFLTLIAAGSVSFSIAAIDRIKFLKEELEKAKARQQEIERWQKKAYQQNQAFLLAAPHLTPEQVKKIQKDIESL